MSETKQNPAERLQQLLLSLETCTDETYRVIRDEIFGLAKPEFYETIRKDMYHPHYRRRMAAATNLGRLHDEKAVSGLIGLLQDPMSEVREMAVFSLGLIGSTEAISPILELLGDFNNDVRCRVLAALADLNYPLLEGVLIRAMSDDHQGVREQALTQLKKVGTPKCGAVVLRALLEQEYEMQSLAEEVLDRIIHGFTDASYLLINEGLSLRERRLILNYLEQRNLQFVYPKLYEVLHSGYTQRPSSKLSKYGRLLNEKEEQRYLMHAYGREKVVDELYEHFMKDNRRSIILVGEPGSGKTAITHELVRRLIAHNPKSGPPKWTILETSTTELITETRFLGEWETKLKKMMEAIEEVDGDVLLYLTNPNDLLGAGAHSNSEENFADFFRPYLQRGQIKIIAETSPDELRTGLTKDPGFLRLFKQIQIPTMTSDETLQVVTQKMENQDFDTIREITGDNPSSTTKKKKRRIPYFKASPSLLDTLVYFANSFMTRTSFPGGACDLLHQVVDQLFDNYEKKLVDEAYERELNEKEMIDGKHVLSIQLKDITDSLSKNTGMPLSILDPTVPLDLEEAHKWFSERLIGQPDPVDAIVNKLATIKSGMNDPLRPLGIFFLVGPTGVGKTYFSKLVAKYLFGDEERMIRFDLSEYQNHYGVDKLIGTPNSRDKEGLLTEAIRNQPFSVILLDEFEKAHKDVYTLFLQVFDEARLSDSLGRTTDFRQTVILITSNLGASKTSVTGLGFGADSKDNLREKIQERMTQFFPPEFINRLDQIIPFDPLTQESMDKLVENELKVLTKRRGLRRNGITMSLADDARKWLEKNGFSEQYGARHLLRSMNHHIVPSVSRLLVKPTNTYGKHILVRCKKDGDPDLGADLVAEWSEPTPFDPRGTDPSDPLPVEPIAPTKTKNLDTKLQSPSVEASQKYTRKVES